MNDFVQIPFDEYLAINAMSKTAMWAANRSLRYYKHVRENGIEETDAMRRGTAGHAALLEPEKFASTYAVMPDFTEGLTTKDGKPTTSKNSSEYRKRVANWTIENPGVIPIEHDFMADLRGMRSMLDLHGFVSELVGRLVVREGSLAWTCPRTSAPCKCRFDGVSEIDGAVVGWDYKVVTEAATPEAWVKKSIGFGYHVGAAHYMDGFARATGEVLDRFVFVVQESNPPYDIVVYEYDRPTIMLGIQTRLRLIRAIMAAEEAGEFPGYPEDVRIVSAPEWAFSDEERKVT
jgi:exodeoxyribonuclease VIII